MNLHHAARLANVASYDSASHESYLDGAPHLKHESLRRLYRSLTSEIVTSVGRHGRPVRVLDLGAGDGSATEPFLDLGAQVVAIDTSERQLARLRLACSAHADRLETRCEDVTDALDGHHDSFDIVVASSFLHHIPDYLSIIQKAAARVRPGGFFFSFQDLRRYDRLPRASRLFSAVAYFRWRAQQGDVVSGMGRLVRRQLGVYYRDSPQDSTEFHLVRNGVDENAIAKALEALRFRCRVVPYFSTQSPFWQQLGECLHVENTFAVIARRDAPRLSTGPREGADEALPRVSFVIPTFNEEHDIARTLDAVLRIDYPAKEILVVDDSTDSTPAIVARYEGRGVQMLHPEVRRGRCAARNLGIRRATGDIVVILNADVFPDPDFLKRAVKHYEAGADFLLVQSRVANQEAVLARYIEAIHRFNYPDVSRMLWTEGFSCRRQAALDAGLFPDGFPIPLTAGEDGCFGRALAERFHKAVDTTIVVPHVAPPGLREFWRERVSRGRATPVCKLFLEERSMARVVSESLAKTLLRLVVIAGIVPWLWRGFQLSRHSAHPRADVLPFGAATALEWAGQIVGEWQSLGRLWRAPGRGAAKS